MYLNNLPYGGIQNGCIPYQPQPIDYSEMVTYVQPSNLLNNNGGINMCLNNLPYGGIQNGCIQPVAYNNNEYFTSVQPSNLFNNNGGINMCLNNSPYGGIQNGCISYQSQPIADNNNGYFTSLRSEISNMGATELDNNQYNDLCLALVNMIASKEILKYCWNWGGQVYDSKYVHAERELIWPINKLICAAWDIVSNRRVNYLLVEHIAWYCRQAMDKLKMIGCKCDAIDLNIKFKDAMEKMYVNSSKKDIEDYYKKCSYSVHGTFAQRNFLELSQEDRFIELYDLINVARWCMVWAYQRIFDKYNICTKELVSIISNHVFAFTACFKQLLNNGLTPSQIEEQVTGMVKGLINNTVQMHYAGRIGGGNQ